MQVHFKTMSDNLSIVRLYNTKQLQIDKLTRDCEYGGDFLKVYVASAGGTGADLKDFTLSS